MQTKKYNRKKSVKFKCFASLVIVLIKQINKQKYLLLPLRQKTEGRFYIIKVGRKQKRMQSKKIKQKKQIHLPHWKVITSGLLHFSSVSLIGRMKRKKSRKSSSFIMKNKQKKSYFRKITSRKNTNRAKAQTNHRVSTKVRTTSLEQINKRKIVTLSFLPPGRK